MGRSTRRQEKNAHGFYSRLRGQYGSLGLGGSGSGGFGCCLHCDLQHFFLLWRIFNGSLFA